MSADPARVAGAVYVRRDDLAAAEIAEIDAPPLADGAVRLAVESFSVTANNVTYAVAGDSFGYWRFFEAPEGRGIVPVWGHARIAESRHRDLVEDERVYGFLPMATQVDLRPGRISDSAFVDDAEHRREMSPVYRRYARLAADPEHDPDREDERMLYGPLFSTGFLLEGFLRRESWFGADHLVVTSASSKTAMSLASVARVRSPAIERVGLTSPDHLEFVRNSDLYDLVLSYEEVAELPSEPMVSVDFAGNAGLLGELHRGLGESLRYSCLVGATHVARRAGGVRGLPGPQPTLFFAPDHAVALRDAVGLETLRDQLASSWHRFLDDVGGIVTIERRAGLDAAAEGYRALLGGGGDPAAGLVVEP